MSEWFASLGAALSEAVGYTEPAAERLVVAGSSIPPDSARRRFFELCSGALGANAFEAADAEAELGALLDAHPALMRDQGCELFAGAGAGADDDDEHAHAHAHGHGHGHGHTISVAAGVELHDGGVGLIVGQNGSAFVLPNSAISALDPLMHAHEPREGEEQQEIMARVSALAVEQVLLLVLLVQVLVLVLVLLLLLLLVLVLTVLVLLLLMLLLHPLPPIPLLAGVLRERGRIGGRGAGARAQLHAGAPVGAPLRRADPGEPVRPGRAAGRVGQRRGGRGSRAVAAAAAGGDGALPGPVLVF